MGDTRKYWQDGKPLELIEIDGSERWWMDGVPQLGAEAGAGAGSEAARNWPALGAHAGAGWCTP